jgi:hypothetical protein
VIVFVEDAAVMLAAEFIVSVEADAGVNPTFVAATCV